MEKRKITNVCDIKALHYEHYRSETTRIWNEINEEYDSLGSNENIENRNEKLLSPVTQNIIYRHLRSIFSFAKANRYIKKNPLIGMKELVIPEEDPVFHSEDEIETALSEAKKHSIEMLIVFALGIYAGLRRSEIIYAKWGWFDFEKNTIRVGKHGAFVTKGKKARTIPMHEKLASILLQFQESKGYLVNSDSSKKSNTYMRYYFYKSFRTVCKNAGLKKVTPHTLRHTFESQLAIKGVSIYKIQCWMGHKDLKTTMIYAHLNSQDDDINRI